MTSHALQFPEPGERSSLFAGRAMFGRYRIQRILGRGGMGVVWLARDERLDRAVAMKFLPDVCFLDAASRDDLKRETRRSLELTHPNIVRIYDFVEDEEAAAISMEYVDGATLSHLRVEKEERCFQPAELGRWVTELCTALDYAHHGACVVHRDLKPSNLMVTSRGALKVADFGIACGLQNTAARVSAWNSTGGTLGYMSPQQLAGELASPSDDLYSVGALLYELLTGKPPFYSGDISLQIRTAIPPTIAQRRSELGMAGGPIPREWEETLAACLAKRPQDRPPTAREIAQRLGLESEGAAACESTPAESLTVINYEPPAVAAVAAAATAAPARRRPAHMQWWIAAGIMIALMLGVLAGSGWLRARTPPPAVKEPAIPSPAAVAEISGIALLQADPSGTQVSISGGEAGVAPVVLASALPPALPEPEPPVLSIVSTPPGAPFILYASAFESPDNEAIGNGTTPATIDDIRPGSYRIVFGGKTWPERAMKVEVAERGISPVDITFPHGTVAIESLPPGAEIFADDESRGFAPLTLVLPAGDHVVTAEYNGRTARPRNVALAAEGRQNLRFDFTPSSGGSTAKKSSRVRKKEPEASPFTKIGRSISKFFTGQKPKK